MLDTEDAISDASSTALVALLVAPERPERSRFVRADITDELFELLMRLLEPVINPAAKSL